METVELRLQSKITRGFDPKGNIANTIEKEMFFLFNFPS